MFRITETAEAVPILGADIPPLEGTLCYSRADLEGVIERHPGEFAVSLWNKLPGVTPITTKKFRNRATAVERIWRKLCELYPDAILPEDMVKRNVQRNVPDKTARVSTVAPAKTHKSAKRSTAPPSSDQAKRGKLSWATQLTEELRKRFQPDQEFSIQDVYKLVPAFQRKHRENHHVAARLRTTLGQDLVAAGVVKPLKQRGQYRMK